MFLDQDKIDVYSKLPKNDAKDALLDYLDTEFGVRVAKNYSFERMVRVAEQRIREKKEEEHAREQVESEKFHRTNITPADILNGDTSIIKYKPKITEPDEFGEVPAAALLPEAPVIPAKLLATSIGGSEAQEISIDVTDGDLILHDTFRPTFDLSMRTPDGRECTTIGYWVIDEIVKLGSMWKIAAPNSRYHNELMSLIHYIHRDGQVIVRESRNSTYIILK